jgi:hypothetical protein
MNPRGGRPTAALGRLLVSVYPEPWRERYRAEMLALLEDDPPGVAGLASLLAGAAEAHLHSRQAWRGDSPPQARMRLSVGAIFCGWIALSLMGAGFQKETENFSAAAHRHPLLVLAHGAILAGALLGAAAIAVGGLPLLWQAIAQAYRRRDGRLAALLALPALAVLAFGGATWLLIAVAPARDGGFPATFVLAVGLPWTLAAITCALVCALVPRAVLRRVECTQGSLRLASRAGTTLALAMCAVTFALILYELSLCLQAPAQAGEATGPLGASVGATLAGHCLLAAIASAAALLSAVRARRAALEIT